MSSRATIEEVADAAGVSRSTVSRVVNGSTSVSAEALTSVRAAIERLSYVPNRAARSLASRQTHAIALIVPEDTTRFFGDPFFASIVAGITGRLRASDYLLNLLVASDDPGDKMTSFVRNGGVDGALIVSQHTSDAFIERIADAVPVVYGGRPVRSRDNDYYVDVDNVAASRTATEHLIARGCTRIATISGPLTMLPAIDRIQGFRNALADAGLTPFAEAEGDYSEESGAEAAERILAVGTPDAIFVGSDLMARGALRVLRAAGLSVPEDVAVMGFDDSAVAASSVPPMTTMRQPMVAQGETMANVLLDRLSGGSPDHVTILPTELVVRRSA
ncbi:LacI family transcriptional regulator [Microbacterium sp. CH12i]|uniref:LacI family DNA-binding transcriptional regulator n=1 Tax=Microbacterium sp. CH12i TaxID=1479651 RepID=UPI000461383E|nr:LacI family DNA-binding transcriptional regulator [Microbacterium sp. CH12i]KDA04674.1 LacI family transcriptional regulator [Microbacterium sp. CH12i]